MDEKSVIRKLIRNRRKSLTPEQQNLAAQQLAENIIHHPKVQTAKTVALFLSFDGEINTQPAITTLWQLNKKVCIPVLHPFNANQLLFLHYQAETEMRINKMGIDEPVLDIGLVTPLSLIDIIFTPLVAFDKHKNRLGMGGGYYDRLFEHRNNYHYYPIGIAHDCQQVDHIPTEDWDQPLPEIITPTQIVN